MSKNRIYSCILIMLLGIMGVSCAEVFEADLSKVQLNVISPSADLETPYYNQTFFWDKVDGAIQYRLQIVSPSFDNLQLFIVDTVCTGDKFVFTLKPGRYQWRMRAENYNYSTDYVMRNLIVDTSSLDIQYPTLLSPSSNYYTQNPSFNFSWIEIFGASKYYIEIDASASNFTNPVKKDSTSNGAYSYAMTADGAYKWRVRATDGTLYSSWSEVRYITLDRTIPATVTLSSPASGITSATPFTCIWNSISDADHYKFYLYKSDSLTYYNSTYPLNVAGTQTVVQNGTSGETVWWAVKAVDRAGNESALSERRKIKIQ